MISLLFILSICAFMAALVLYQTTEGVLLLLCATQLFVGAAVVDAIVTMRKKLVQK